METDGPKEVDTVTGLLLIITWQSVAVKLCFFPSCRGCLLFCNSCVFLFALVVGACFILN